MADETRYCKDCGKDMEVSERPGQQNTDQLAYVLVCPAGHVVAERASKDQPWKVPADFIRPGQG